VPRIIRRMKLLSNDDPLAGDLREESTNGKSARWHWGQVIAVIATATTSGVRCHSIVVMRAIRVCAVWRLGSDSQSPKSSPVGRCDTLCLRRVLLGRSPATSQSLLAVYGRWFPTLSIAAIPRDLLSSAVRSSPSGFPRDAPPSWRHLETSRDVHRSSGARRTGVLRATDSTRAPSGRARNARCGCRRRRDRRPEQTSSEDAC
jgi:hypothetical protein